MLLEFRATFNLHKDVLPWILEQGAPDDLERSSRTLRIVNVERNGRIIYTWKGTGGSTNIGLHDPPTKRNELLYSFEKNILIVSCSVNYEKSLLGLSYYNSAEENRYEPLRPVSKYLALLIEIQPINNVRVLKAVDSSVRVQFLYPEENSHPFPESHLLLVSEEKYIEQYHISLGIEDDNKVVITTSGKFPKDRIAEDFVWVQWDMTEQRLFFIIPKCLGCVLHCVQFYPDDSFKMILEVPLEISFTDQSMSLINLGLEHPKERGRGRSTSPNLQVFSNKSGGLCLFYVQPLKVPQEVSYMVAFLHTGCCKTFNVPVSEKNEKQLKKVSFINVGSYVAVYLPDHFLHLINTRHPNQMCYHLFLSDDDARISGICCDCPIQSVLRNSVVENCTGILFSVSINQLFLLKFLWRSRLDCERLAALHCFLLHLDLQPQWETQIVEWICENLSTCQNFDPMQEFIIASLFRKLSLETVHLDKLLPYTSVPFWKEDIDGVFCTTDIIDMPILKIGTFKGFWEKFHSQLEYMKHAQQRFHCSNNMHRRDWCKLISEVDTEEKRNAIYQRNVLENTKKIILNMDIWRCDHRTVPLYQEEDYLQKDLMGLIVVKLKDHLLQHLHHVGRNKIDKIVLDYVSKQLDLVCQILEVVWKKYNIESSSFCISGRGGPSEYFAFYLMCHISEATSKLCMPLPPGFHTLHLVLGVRCLPLGNLLHYVDTGVLQLTETFVAKLLKELDDNEKNENLKYGIIIRIPERICEKVHHLWDHAISNNFIARKYVERLLCKLKKRELSRQSVTNLSTHYINFLPLNYLIKMLSEVEVRALNPFEEDNIDAAFLEEIALKQTAVLLGLQKN
ncbi:gamma-secretase-activating protein [Rhinophrynus dorsalis]